MNQFYFFSEQKKNTSATIRNIKNPLVQKLVLCSFLVLSFLHGRAQTAPNISYTTQQNYLLNAAITNLAPANSGGSIPAATYKQVSTFAGTTSGFLDGTGTAAKMNGPLGMTMDASGDIYFIDSVNFRIRKLMAKTGEVTTIAGDGYSFAFFGRLKNNADGSLASFNYPADLALDTANNCLYVTDKENDVIRKVSLAGDHEVTTFAGSGTSTSTDGTGLLAKFKKPSGIAIDPTGTYLYVTDRSGNKIRRIPISTAQVTTIAGSGSAGTTNSDTGASATFNDPTGIAVDANYIYVTDFGGHKIRKISKTTPYPVTTLAGSGTSGAKDDTGALATFNNPYGLTLDPAGNLFVAEWGNKIRKITPSGVVTTFAGSGVASSLDANGVKATFNDPSNIIIDPTLGVGYVSEYTGDQIRKIELSGYELPSSPALPADISFDVTTGTFSGTPSAINNGPVSYTITGYNYYGSSTATVAITTGTLAALTTTAASPITATTATTGGNVTSNGGMGYNADTGQTTLIEKGICWSTSANPTILNNKVVNSSTAIGSYTDEITGLAPLTTYYVRAYATNVLGTAYGTQVSFTTKVEAPVISYNPTNQFTTNTAITALQVNNTGGAIATTGALVTTFAGNDIALPIDGTGTAASFHSPFGIVTGADGNFYVSEFSKQIIRKITPSGVVSTFAGSGINGNVDGIGTEARFSGPSGMAVDSAGNIYVADRSNHKIRKITPSGVVSTFAGSGTQGSTDAIGTEASFFNPVALALDSKGNIFVSDNGNHKIRKITPAGVVSTFAGNEHADSIDGVGTSASFYMPWGLVIDPTDNVYVAGYDNKIRKITPSGQVSTFAGSGIEGSGINPSADGIGSLATFKFPIALTIDAIGNLYVNDSGNKKIRKITASGVVTTIAGTGTSGFSDGEGNQAKFDSPTGININTSGDLFVVDNYNHRIRKISIFGFYISPALPAGLVLNTNGSITGTPTVTSPATTYTITAANAGGSSSTTVNIAVVVAPPAITYTASNQFTVNTAIPPLQVSNTGGAIPSGFKDTVNTIAGSGTAGSIDGTGIAASFNQPSGVTVDTAGNVYVIDKGNNKIRKITAAGVVTTFAGSGIIGSTDGTGTAASFNNPYKAAVDATGNIYVTDANNHKIRKITAAGVVTTLAGNGTQGAIDGTGVEASFRFPQGLVLDAAGNIYVADTFNHKIRKITPSGVVTTFAGSGTAGATDGTGTDASFYQPVGVTMDANGTIYVTDRSNNKIRKITPAGVVTTFAGSGTAGSIDGTGTEASFRSPCGVGIDATGAIYVADKDNEKIRKITPAGVVTTFAGNGTQGASDGTRTAASFKVPYGVAVDLNGNVYIGDLYNNKIRKITEYGYSVSPALPAGLTLNANGSITGTPTVASPATTYTLTATNAGGSSTYSVNIEILPTLPNIATGVATAITTTSASVVGNITSNGNATITAQGVCWSTAPNPTLANSTTTDTSGTTTFTNTLSNLLPSTIYYARAYATNSLGTAYGNEIVFTTLTPIPVISYTTANNLVINTAITPLLVTNTGGAVPSTLKITDVTTFSGNGSSGVADGIATSANFAGPSSVATDIFGNVYVADRDNNKIRKITPNGTATTFAGSGNQGATDGTGTGASFFAPEGVAVDALGNVYVADSANNRIRKITPSGVVSTLAGGKLEGNRDGDVTSATFSNPKGVAVDAAGNVYVADTFNHSIRKIAPSGDVTTLAGGGRSGSSNGPGFLARFSYPQGIAVDAEGTIFVADNGNHEIRKITPDGEVSSFAGGFGSPGFDDGPGVNALFSNPRGVSVDVYGNVYVADSNNFAIRKITSSGDVSTLAGNGSFGSENGTFTTASFSTPTGVSVDALGNVYVADSSDNKIRKISQYGYSVTPALPAGLTLNTDGSISGTPTVESNATNYTIKATNAGGSSTKSVSIAVYSLPELTTNSVTGITATHANSGGTLISLGNLEITNIGVCWSTSSNPTIADNNTDDFVLSDTFDSYISNLLPLTTYYVRAYATNSAGIAYGNEISFTTQLPTPVISYSTPNVFNGNTAITPLQVINTGGAAVQYTVAPALPTGLVLNADGSISGTPTAAKVASNYVVRATNAGGFSTFTISIAVQAAAATPPTAIDQTSCSGAKVADLVATGTNLKWYTGATGGTALATNTTLVTGAYYVSQTVSGSESTRTSVAVTVNTTAVPTASAQTFCGSKTVADLAATGTNLKWYAAATGGTALDSSTALATGTYYVSQTLNSCESARTSVAVTVNSSIAGTVSAGQLIVRGTQPAPISLTRSFGSVQWQASTNNTTFTNIVGATSTTLTSAQMGVLTSKRFYRAIIKSGDCSSVTSGVVQVLTTLETKVQDSQCGQTLANLSYSVTADYVPGADKYRFKVVNGATTRTFETSARGFSLTSLEGGALYNTSYTISVATQSVGLWSDYGPQCTIITPSGLTKIQDTQCGSTVAALNTLINANSVYNVSNYRFKVVQGATTRILESSTRGFSLTSLEGGALYNTQYKVSVATKYNGVWGDYGTECTVSTPIVPASKVVDIQCGTTLPDLFTIINAKWVTGASNYRFKVVNGATTRTIETVNNAFSLSSLSGENFYNTTYTISVATKNNDVWSDYGTSCTVSTPIVPPATKVIDAQCGMTLADLKTIINANWISGVSNYRFKVVNGATTRTIETVNRAFSLTSLSGGSAYNTTYTISVATKANGVWGDYGPSCTVSTPSNVARTIEVTKKGVALETVASEATVVNAYPNPFTTTFKFDFTSASDSNIDVTVYDMSGKQIDTFQVMPSEINNLAIGNKYPSGVYNVIVTQGTEVKTLRVIKQ